MKYILFTLTTVVFLFSCKEKIITFETDVATVEEKSFTLPQDYLPYITQVHSDGKTFACEAYKPFKQVKDGTEQTIVARYLITEKKVYGPYDDIKLIQISPYDGDVVFAAQPVGDKAYYVYSAQDKKGPFTDVKLLITSPYDTTTVFVIKENVNEYVMWNSVKKGPFQSVEKLAFLPCGASVPIFQTSHQDNDKSSSKRSVFIGEIKQELQFNPSDENWKEFYENKYIKTAIFINESDEQKTHFFDPNFPLNYGSPQKVFFDETGCFYISITLLHDKYRVVEKKFDSFNVSESLETLPQINFFDNGKMFYTYESKKSQFLVFEGKTYGPFISVTVNRKYWKNNNTFYALAFTKHQTNFFNGSIIKTLQGEAISLFFDEQKNLFAYSTKVKEGTYIPFKKVDKEYTIVNDKKYSLISSHVYQNTGSTSPLIVEYIAPTQENIIFNGKRVPVNGREGEVRISPDSKSYAYVTRDSSGHYLHVNEEKKGPFEDIGEFDFSPDSSTFFYTVQIDKKYYVYTGAKIFGPYKHIENVWFEKNSNQPTIVTRTITDKFLLVSSDGTTREESHISAWKSIIIIDNDHKQLLFNGHKSKEYSGYINLISAYPNHNIAFYIAHDTFHPIPNASYSREINKIMINGKEYLGLIEQSAVVYIDGESLYIKDLQSFKPVE